MSNIQNELAVYIKINLQFEKQQLYIYVYIFTNFHDYNELTYFEFSTYNLQEFQTQYLTYKLKYIRNLFSIFINLVTSQ